MFKNAKLLTLFFTMLVTMVGFGIIIPIMPFYVEHFGAGGSELGLMMASFSVMQFVSSPFWGSLSDRYGRKRIMMIGVFGNMVSLIVIGLAQSFWVMFAARVFEGLLSSATLPTAMAYISDSTSDEERGGGMGVIGAAMGVGMILGPGLGGLVAGSNLSLPFFLAAGMSFLSIGMIWFVLPESLPEAKRTLAVKMRGVQLDVLWRALVGPAGFMFFLAFLVNFALANFEGIFGLYADHRYGYGPTQVGTLLMVVGLVTSLAQAFLTGPATRRFGEATVIKASLIASAIGFVLMTWAVQNWAVVVTVGFFVFANAMLRPSIMSLTSKTSQGGQGMALGLNNSFQSLGRVVGPLWAGLFFDYNVNLPYLTAAVVMLLTFGYAIWKMNPARMASVLFKQPAAVPINAGED
jgi:DHA1 family multidrug resistance protein-like MFS transporter